MQIHPSDSSLTQGEVEVMLDGLPIGLPASRRSLTAIHSYLETIALEQQRILCSLNVDGEPANLTQPLKARATFHHIEAETVSLEDMPLQLLKTARQQTAFARAQVESAVALVLINDGRMAREFWWELARKLKEPLLTLSLLPDDYCGPENGRASLSQLRKWQLQQLAAIIRDVDESCQTENTITLSNALEHRALKWLDQLQELVTLWLETATARSRLQHAA
jgi:hypothetical protein